MFTNFWCAYCAPTIIIFMINRKFIFILPFLLVTACSKSKDTTSMKDVQQPEVLVQTDHKRDVSRIHNESSKSDTRNNTPKEVTKGRKIEKKQQKGYYDIPYDKKTRSIKVDNLFKNIKYVRLETKNESLLDDNIDKIESKNGIIYIKDNKSSGPEEFLFDEKGKYLRYIDRCGQGPEEYINGVNIAINDKGNVSFADRSGERIVTYTSEGNFISRINLSGIDLKDLTYLNDTILVLRSDMFQAGYKYHILNLSTGKVVKSLYQKEYRPYHMWFTESLTARHGRVIAAGYQSNDIVEITLDTAMVKYTLNIGNKMPPSGFWEKQPSYDVTKREEKSNGYIGHIPFFAENERYMFISFMGSLGQENLQSLALVDKQTGKSRTFKQIVVAENLVVEPYIFYWLSNGQIVFPIWPEKIIESGNKDFLAQFPDLKEDDNPILLFGELK